MPVALDRGVELAATPGGAPYREAAMPEGDKSSYTDKQKRKAEHIEEGYKKEGVSAKTAAARAWATVNKQDGGGKKRAAKSSRSAKKTRTGKKTRMAARRTTRAGR